MCKNNPKTYRVVLNSVNKINGTNQSGSYLIKLPFVVGNGMLHVESLTLADTGTLVGKKAVKVLSPSFPNPYVYETDNNHHHTIGSIAIEPSRTTIGTALYYSTTISSSDIGYPVNNFSLDNQQIQIDLTDELNVALTAAQIGNYQLTLLFVDFSEDRSDGRAGGFR